MITQARRDKLTLIEKVRSNPCFCTGALPYASSDTAGKIMITVGISKAWP